MDKTNYMTKRVYAALQDRGRKSLAPFIKEFVRYARAEGSGDSVAQVAAYLNGLEPVAPAVWNASAVSNSSVLQFWLDDLGMTNAEVLAWVRASTIPDILTRFDPDNGVPVQTDEETNVLMVTGDEFAQAEWGADLPWPSDVNKDSWVRSVDGLPDYKDHTATVGGVPVTVRETAVYLDGVCKGTTMEVI